MGSRTLLCASTSANPTLILSNSGKLKKMALVKASSNRISLPKSPSSILSTLSSIARIFHTSFSNILDPPLHPSIDPNHVFTGNFAPVDELGPVQCPVVKGELPSSLNGVYIRNGPNPQHKPIGALHLFDGDGMLHSLQFSNGKATYCSRYVKTYKYLVELRAGSPLIPNLLSGLNGLIGIVRFIIAILRLMSGHIHLRKGFGVANTSLAFFAHKLLALCESDLPYIIGITKDGGIETLGRWEFDTRLLANMTAHPKVDADTNEMFAFSCSLFFPYLTLFHFNERGVKQGEVPILSIKQPSFIHDFAITKRFAIIQEAQLTLSASKSVLGRGTLVDYNPHKSPRIGIIPRYASNDSDMKWFEIPGFNALHILNAWEDGEHEVVIVASNNLSIQNIFDKRLNFSLEMVKIDTRTGKVRRSVLSPRNLELGSINPSYVGKKNRYAYIGVLEEVPKMSGVVKIDLEAGCEVGRRFFQAGCFGGEPLFVKRCADDRKRLASDDDEDDGFVVSFVHDEKAKETKFVVMNARSLELQILAEVRLPRRVPYGFHGIFVSNDNLQPLS